MEHRQKIKVLSFEDLQKQIFQIADRLQNEDKEANFFDRDRFLDQAVSRIFCRIVNRALMSKRSGQDG